MKKQVYLALGTPQKFVQLGNFCVKVHDQSMNVYSNMDLGSGTYKNMETAHRSFHSSGHSQSLLPLAKLSLFFKTFQ
jgi:hypothetical protein